MGSTGSKPDYPKAIIANIDQKYQYLPNRLQETPERICAEKESIHEPGHSPKDPVCRLKVLLSSGYSINGQATEIMDRACNGFIQKPFKMKELSQKLREILD